MAVIDSQVHVYEANRPERPWVSTITGPAHVTGDEQVAAMDALGIDGAIIVSTYTTYRYDSSYAQEVHTRHPGRFALVKPVDTTDPAVAEDIAQWASAPGAVGIRVMLTFAETKDPLDPGLNLALTAGARHGMAVNLFAWHHLDEARALVARHPDTLVVIDHVGLPQPYRPDGPDIWADLPKVLALAEHDNVRIKLSGAGTMSAQAFPYDDIWNPLLRIIDAFGVERCLWGTDWTRAVKSLSYEQGVEAFRTTPHLSDSDRAMLMGGAAERTYGWSPSPGA
ncbi:L-fuconolactonase [Novosphingobium sp. CF614]|uniref:amidohydrolase family protein n=1 Tax=Novosphingobium sp. CF614 TaxID=1884364 RepID=UPI0008EE4B31|nr:amidohydrolase family protein [Novosphingobium sp. CF614]SFF77470.1 L-fuconolactonase [Novosphingobium sp. CF614]